jgi:hypothetical protein
MTRKERKDNQLQPVAWITQRSDIDREGQEQSTHRLPDLLSERIPFGRPTPELSDRFRSRSTEKASEPRVAKEADDEVMGDVSDPAYHTKLDVSSRSHGSESVWVFEGEERTRKGRTEGRELHRGLLGVGGELREHVLVAVGGGKGSKDL